MTRPAPRAHAARNQPRVSLLGLALAGETLLVVVALAWARYRGIALSLLGGPWLRDAAAGVLAAAALAVVNYALLCRAPPVRAVRALRHTYREVLKPLFAGLGTREVVVISAAAGIGEELLFRGVLQPEIGLLPASLIFGVLHVAGRGTLVFGGWVAVMGAALGWLAEATGGLLAPILAHALYDAAALVYIRRARDCAAVGEPGGEPGAREDRESPGGLEPQA